MSGRITVQLRLEDHTRPADCEESALVHDSIRLELRTPNALKVTIGGQVIAEDETFVELGLGEEARLDVVVLNKTPVFPLETGKFDRLVVTGVTGNPIIPEPDEKERLIVRGELEGFAGIEEFLPDGDGGAAVIANGRRLIVIGDAEVEQDDPYITAAWSTTVQLDPMVGPIVLGWRIRYVADGFSFGDSFCCGPCVGLTTLANLISNSSTNAAPNVLNYCATKEKSALYCTATAFSVGSQFVTVSGLSQDMRDMHSYIPESGNVNYLPGKIVALADGKCDVEFNDGGCMSGVDPSRIRGLTQFLPAELPVVPELPAEVELVEKEEGGFEYDVVCLFDSAKQEVRAGVGGQGNAMRFEKVAVPPELWPSNELVLLPCVSIVCEDFCGMNNIDQDQLPISFEALAQEHIPQHVVDTLLQL